MGAELDPERSNCLLKTQYGGNLYALSGMGAPQWNPGAVERLQRGSAAETGPIRNEPLDRTVILCYCMVENYTLISPSNRP